MWAIEEEFDDYSRHKYKGSIVLNPSKTIHFQFTDYPVKWNGLINGEKIEIVLNSSSSSFLENYEWPIYPEKYNDLKNQIVRAIDKYIDRVMS